LVPPACINRLTFLAEDFQIKVHVRLFVPDHYAGACTQFDVYTKPGRKFGERFTWFFQSSLLLVERRDACAASIFPLVS
jgi:hypothetical protein